MPNCIHKAKHEVQAIQKQLGKTVISVDFRDIQDVTENHSWQGAKHLNS